MNGTSAAQDKIAVSDIVSWAFCILFFVIGVLNLFLIHPVPGIFYLLLSSIYLPKTNIIFRRSLGFSIPLSVKVILALVILWGTLAVGELAEMAGF